VRCGRFRSDAPGDGNWEMDDDMVSKQNLNLRLTAANYQVKRLVRAVDYPSWGLRITRSYTLTIITKLYRSPRTGMPN